MNENGDSMDAAVVHDGAGHPGGGARVATEAATALDADLYLGYSGVDIGWWDERTPHDVHVLTGMETSSRLRDLWLIRTMLTLDLSGYDLVLTSGPVTKFYHPADGQRRAHYMHHPPLPLLWYDGSLLLYPFSVIDRVETGSIETLIANSELTAKRARSLYGRDPAVVNPPVDVERFEGERDPEPGKVVMVGRLEERKRPRIAVEAFTSLDAELHLIGDGPLRDELERQALGDKVFHGYVEPDNVVFHGYVDDDELREHLLTAEAGLFVARREDFGVTPIEYLAAGLPVVGVDEPNTNNQIVDGELGCLVKPDVHGVTGGIRDVLDEEWDTQTLRDAASTYRPTVFRKGLDEALP
ncbi:MAG: glycosyltransferase [Halodesulfurarchaeum sp.]